MRSFRPKSGPFPRLSPTPLQKRLLWLGLLFIVQLLYFPINRTVQGGVILRIPLLDDLIPLWLVWVIPYLLSLPWWSACFIWATVKMEARLYRAFLIALLVVMLSSYVVYIVYPTYVERPVVEGQGLLADLVRWLYSSDQVNNAFPSGHTYTTVLIALFWWHWRPRQRWLWLAISVLIILSTLFTGQHHSPDPLGGVLFAWLGYRFGLWWVDRKQKGS